MYCTNTGEAETLPLLKEYYVNDIIYEYENYGKLHSFDTKDIKYLVYQHTSGMEVNLSKRQRLGMIDDIEEKIDEEVVRIKNN